MKRLISFSVAILITILTAQAWAQQEPPRSEAEVLQKIRGDVADFFKNGGKRDGLDRVLTNLSHNIHTGTPAGN